MSAQAKAAIILGFFLMFEGAWVALNASEDPSRFLSVLGFATGGWGTSAGWCLAALVTAAFVHRSMRLPSVRANLLKPSLRKALALLMAIAAGILEQTE